MKLSVIVPTYNKVQELKKCLKSLLTQQRPSDEIVVIDNSYQKDQKIKKLILKLKKLAISKIEYYHEKKRGASFCRNVGIKKSSGDILAFVDDDCIVKKDWTKAILYFVNKYKNSIIVGKNIEGKSILSRVQFYRSKRVFTDTIYKINNIQYCRFIDTKNFALPRSLINKYKLFFDTSPGFCRFSSCEDLDLSMRVKKSNIPIIYCDRMISYHKGANSVISLVLREFTKGRAFYHFKLKWPDYRLADSRFSVVTDISKFQVLILFLLISLVNRIGFIYEEITS